MFKRILVAVDGSESGDHALVRATQLAHEQRAALRIVHVAGEVAPVSAEALSGDRLLEAVYDAARAMVADAAVKAQDQAVRAESAVLEGGGQRVSQVIADDARAWSADLVVIGSHGRRGLNRLLLGSVAEEVMRVSPCPVLLIRT